MEQYINKAAVVAEIESYISNYKEILAKTDRNDSNWVDSTSMIGAKVNVLQHLLFYLDTLETEEVDLKKEINDIFPFGESRYVTDKNYNQSNEYND